MNNLTVRPCWFTAETPPLYSLVAFPLTVYGGVLCSNIQVIKLTDNSADLISGKTIHDFQDTNKHTKC